MSDVAKRADVPIGSVYQYFSSREVLIARLFAREMEPVDASLRSGLSQVASLEDVIAGIGKLIRSHVELVRARPGLMVIWSSPTMHPDLQRADLENSRQNARVITNAIVDLQGDASNREEIGRAALLICHLWGSAIRLSVLTEADDPNARVIDQFIEMVTAHLRRIVA